MNVKKYNIVIMGATGLVGKELIQILHERSFPVNNLYLIASDKSFGSILSFGTKNLTVDCINNVNANNIDLVFNSVNDQISPITFNKFRNTNAIIIDKSSTYRKNSKVKLIVSDVNDKKLQKKESFHQIIDNLNIVSMPNCCVIPIAIVFFTLITKLKTKINRAVISTYQSASGAGNFYVSKLAKEAAEILSFREKKETLYSAFNLSPYIGEIDEDGNSEEENKIQYEINKILEKKIPISVTCVRVPVFIGHSISINIELDKEHCIDEIIKALKNNSQCELHDTEDNLTPKNISGKNKITIGRIRKDYTRKSSFNMWITSDNLRIGAALNAIKTAETIISK